MIRAVLNDNNVKSQFIQCVDADGLALHLTTESILSYTDEYEPLHNIPVGLHRKNHLFQLLLLKLNTYAKFKLFCAKLREIGQSFLAEIFEHRFIEEIQEMSPAWPDQMLV